MYFTCLYNDVLHQATWNIHWHYEYVNGWTLYRYVGLTKPEHLKKVIVYSKHIMLPVPVVDGVMEDRIYKQKLHYVKCLRDHNGLEKDAFFPDNT